MFENILEVFEANEERVLERITGRILESIPRYSLSEGTGLKENVQQLAEDLVEFLKNDNPDALTSGLLEVSRKRVAQGFRISDYIRALLTVFPVFRDIVRESGRARDPAFAADFDRFEEQLFKIAANASEIFATDLLRQLEAKNQALNRLNQKLAAQERAVSLKADLASKELVHANEFNQRVIEALTAGLLVADAQTRNVTLYTSRMEEIAGIPAQDVLGQKADDVFKRIQGLPADEIIQTIQEEGRLPLTKFRLRKPDGKAFTVLVRAERMWDPDGKPEGSVVVVDDVTERELLLDSFSRYVSQDLVRRILARSEPLDLGGELHTCTVLFVDIRGFTGLAESLDTNRLHELLNAYFRVIIDVINSRGGFIDKFIGDNVMAIFDWRAPADQMARSALAAAGEIVRRIRKLNDERKAGGLCPIEVGIGVNTGEVLLGNVGAQERMDFTAIGDPVNVAARLQTLAAPGQVLVGPETARLAGDAVALVMIGNRQIRGRQKPVVIFELELAGEV